MILTCPSCQVHYYADDATIGESGRTVTCSACGHAWHAAPPQSKPKPAAHETYLLKKRQRLQRQSRLAATMVWTATAICFFVLGAAAVVFRDEVARAWPQASAAYNTAGLNVNRFGLDFQETEAVRTFDGTTPILQIRGAVRSVDRRARETPQVRILLRDEIGREVGDAFAAIAPRVLEPGARGEFSAIIESPPLDAFDLEMSFVTSPGEAADGAAAASVDAAPLAEADLPETGGE